MAARISLRVKSGCLATRVKSHSECSSSGEVLPPLGLASTLPVSLRRRHHRITELTPTSNTSATSRRDAPLSTASTARSRKSVEYGFGIDLAPRRINFSRFARAKAVGNPPDSMPPGNALGFNFIRDIEPIAPIVRFPYILVVNPSVPAKTLPEFIAYAKANPGKINMASPGTGTGPHIAAELFKMMAGIDMVHVPYRGATPALTD